MRIGRVTLLIGAAFMLSGSAPWAIGSRPPSLAFVHVTVVAVDTGQLLEDRTVVITGDRMGSPLPVTDTLRLLASAAGRARLRSEVYYYRTMLASFSRE